MIWDYGIVGQGLAGTLLHHYLSQSGQSVCIWDAGGSSCSKISSGILNPLTGRKFVKSWMFDELLKEAKCVYPKLEEALGENFFYERPIYRALPDRQAELEWDYRSSLPEYEPYIGSVSSNNDLPLHLHRDRPFVSILRGHQLRINRFLASYRKSLIEKGQYYKEFWMHSALKRDGDLWNYRGMRCRNLVFSEGAAAAKNPYLAALPFNLSKGEALTMRMDQPLRAIVKKGIFSVPWSSDRWWLGTANFWNYDDETPTPEGLGRILDRFSEMYNLEPGPVLEQMGAIKPTVKDRRPLLGEVEQSMFVFNGLGSKGASLGPYFARQMAEFMVSGKPVLQSVNIAGRQS